MTGHDDRKELNLGLPAAGLVADPAAAGPRDGLSWSWELDVEALLDAVTGPAPWDCGPVKPSGHAAAAEAPKAVPDPAASPVPPVADADPAGSAAPDPGLDAADADLAEYLDAVGAGRSQVVPLPVLAGRVAELVPAGPGLAGWLGTGETGGLEDGALAGIASSYRRLASWAQAGELAVVAELASRSAAADDRAGTGEDGRPAKVTASATAEVSLALTMSQAAASWWTDLAVTLRWRLAATGTALATGAIDLARARAIVDATGCLDEETAQAVQDQVLPKAGAQTTAQLRAALRRAVIAADPDGADRRREEAEKQARVLLYPDDQGTASLGGYSLPGIHAAAAMARITALARALRASGAGGGIDLLRAHVFIGLLLGTLPYIPPPAAAPPDQPPPDDDGPPDGGGHPDGDQPDDGAHPDGDQPQGRTARGGRAPADCPGSSNDHRSRQGRGGPGSHRQDADPTPTGQSGHRDDDSDQPAGHHDDGAGRRPDPGTQHSGRGSQPATGSGQRGQPGSGSGQLRRRDAPHPGRDDPGDPGGPDSGGGRDSPGGPAGHAAQDQDDDEDGSWARPPPGWPLVPALLQPGPAAMNDLTPASGAGKLLDLSLPWATLTGHSPEPGHLGRLGPITPGQARHLADLAATDPATRWRIILTDPAGRAAATTSLTRRGTTHQEPGLIKQVTVAIGLDCLTGPLAVGDRSPILDQVLAATHSLADPTARQAVLDAQTPGGCAHADATTSYRPTTALRDYITARDLTCRFPTCRQPVWRCDCDHTTPYDQGGRTCSCNLGGLCRYHHQVKGQSRWQLEQVTPGIFTWTTPTGRRYTVQPDFHAA